MCLYTSHNTDVDVLDLLCLSDCLLFISKTKDQDKTL